MDKKIQKQIIPIESFKEPGEWFNYCRSRGFAVPVQAGYQIQRCMKDNQISFPEAYRICLEKEIILELEEVNVVFAAQP